MRRLASRAGALWLLALMLACHDFDGDLETCRTSGRCLDVAPACFTSVPSDFGLASPREFDPGSHDLNGDGRVDLAFIDNYNGIGVAPGNGDGTFGPPRYSSAGASARLITSGDFNGDGKMDLAVANSKAVNLLLASGGGAFQAPVSFPTGAVLPITLTPGDVNGDRKLDLLITYGAGSGIATTTSVLLGNGDGTFQPAVERTYTSSFYAWENETTGDFNGDGRLDLLVGGVGMWMLLGSGDGTFQPVNLSPPLPHFYAVAAGDVDGDGHLDLIAATYDSLRSGVRLFLGDGSTFTESPDDAAKINAAYQQSDDPCSLLDGDFNGDGKIDLVVGHINSGPLSLLRGDGNGTFQQAELFPGGRSSCTHFLGDFNGDGKVDLIIPGWAVLLQTDCAP